MYAIVKNGQLQNTGTLESMFISNVFPPSGSAEWMLEHSVYEVIYPNYNPSTHQLALTAPQITGTRVMIHEVVPIPEPQPQLEPQPQSEPQPETIELGNSGGDSIT